MSTTGSEPESASRRRRVIDGWVTGALVALALVFPLHWAFLIANFAFTGCFITCGQETSPILGTWTSLAIAVMVVLPVAVGRVAAGRAGAWAWSVLSAAGAMLLTTVVWTLVPAYLAGL